MKEQGLQSALSCAKNVMVCSDVAAAEVLHGHLADIEGVVGVDYAVALILCQRPHIGVCHDTCMQATWHGLQPLLLPLGLPQVWQRLHGKAACTPSACHSVQCVILRPW